MLKIRNMTENDLAFVTQTEKALFSDAWTTESLAEELSSPFARSYVLLDGDAPASYGLFRLLAGEGEVLRIGTLPSYRRRGYARLLLEYFEAEGKKEGLEKIFLEVRQSNTAARKLYEGTGFREIALRQSYYRDPVEDAVIYEKSEKE